MKSMCDFAKRVNGIIAWPVHTTHLASILAVIFLENPTITLQWAYLSTLENKCLNLRTGKAKSITTFRQVYWPNKGATFKHSRLELIHSVLKFFSGMLLEISFEHPINQFLPQLLTRR